MNQRNFTWRKTGEKLSKQDIMTLDPYIEKFKIIAERVLKLNDILSTEWNITYLLAAP